MSFSLVYCSFCKSSLGIGSCQISSPKIHTGASSAPRTHFNVTGSRGGRKCQRVSGSQSLLQHTWLALQLSETSVFTGAGKKRFLSFESTALVPEQRGFKCCELCSAAPRHWLRVTWRALVSPGQHRGHLWHSLASLSLLKPPFSPGQNSPAVRFQWEMTSRCWICPTSLTQDRAGLCLHSSPNHEVVLAAFPSSNTSQPPTNPLWGLSRAPGKLKAHTENCLCPSAATW